MGKKKKSDYCEYCDNFAPSQATKALHILQHAVRAKHLLHGILRLHFEEGAEATISPDINKAIRDRIDGDIHLAKLHLKHEKKHGKNTKS